MRKTALLLTILVATGCLNQDAQKIETAQSYLSEAQRSIGAKDYDSTLLKLSQAEALLTEVVVDTRGNNKEAEKLLNKVLSYKILARTLPDIDDATAQISVAHQHLESKRYQEAYESYVKALPELALARTQMLQAETDAGEILAAQYYIIYLDEFVQGLIPYINTSKNINNREWRTIAKNREKINPQLQDSANHLIRARNNLSMLIATQPQEAQKYKISQTNIDEIDEIIDLNIELNQWIIRPEIPYLAMINAEDTSSKQKASELATEATQIAVQMGYDVDSPQNKYLQIQRIFYYVRNISYLHDPNFLHDEIKAPNETMKLKAGDCDDHSVLLSSMLESVGFQTTICFVDITHSLEQVQANKELFSPTHMANEVYLPGLDPRVEWVFLDSTCEDCEVDTVPYPDAVLECHPVSSFEPQGYS